MYDNLVSIISNMRKNTIQKKYAYTANQSGYRFYFGHGASSNRACVCAGASVPL